MEEMFPQKGRLRQGGGAAFFVIAFFPRNRDAGQANPGGGRVRGERDSSSFTAAWSVSGESSLASWLLRASMSIQMCPSKMIRLRHAAARTAGGVGVSGRCPDAARWSFIAFRPVSTAKRIRRTAPSCSSPESGDNKKASSKRLNVWRKCCREAEDGVKRDGITFPLDKPVKRLKPLFRAVHRFFHSVVDYSVFWRR